MLDKQITKLYNDIVEQASVLGGKNANSVSREHTNADYDY